LKTLALFALLTATGCTLGGRSAPIRYYVLEPVAEAGATARADTNATTGVGPVTIPRYLDRSGIVAHRDGSELVVDDANRWAEPLDDMLARTISENLVRLTGSSRVFAYPWAQDYTFDHRVWVRVVRFEIGTDGAAHLICQWQHAAGTDEPTLVRSTLTAQPRSSTAGDRVAALAETVAALSAEIAAAIERSAGAD
jgi:uncharacterized protein